LIFVTVGSQLPFDRLVAAVNTWAREAGCQTDVFAQTGETTAPPDSIPWTAELSPEAFKQKVDEADVVVGHAGTGTIMASLCAGKPVVVLARRVGLGETRNDHQVATVDRFRELSGFFGTTEAEEIGPLIEASLASIQSANAAATDGSIPAAPERLSAYASGPMVNRLRTFFDEALR